MVTVYTLAYNEELMLPFMVSHYRTRFPGCRIVIYDNFSSDNTVALAKSLGCEVVEYDTNNQMQDRVLLEIKNHCWKEALTDWVLVCDMDELVEIDLEKLKEEERQGVSIVRTKGFNMVNLEDNLEIASITYGAREPGYDKACLFNKRLIKEINYEIGCHKCNPSGVMVYSQNKYPLYHYMFINEKLTIEKYKANALRLSPENLKRGWSRHYRYTPEQIHDKFVRTKRNAIKVR